MHLDGGGVHADIFCIRIQIQFTEYLFKDSVLLPLAKSGVYALPASILKLSIFVQSKNTQKCVTDEVSEGESILTSIMSDDPDILYRLIEITRSDGEPSFNYSYAARIQIILGALYIAFVKNTKDCKSIINYKQLFRNYAHSSKPIELIHAVILVLDNEDIASDICEFICNKINTKPFSDNLISAILMHLWSSAEYKKLHTFCMICGKHSECSSNISKNTIMRIDFYSHLALSRINYQQRNYSDAVKTISEIIDLIENSRNNEDLHSLLYLEAAFMNSWLIKDLTRENRNDKIRLCESLLKKAELKSDKSYSKEQIMNAISFEREFLEMESGNIIEESIGDDEESKNIKQLEIRKHYLKAFSYFWEIWDDSSRNWEIIKDSDIVNHVWCMIKLLNYTPDQIPYKDIVLSKNDLMNCIISLYESEKEQCIKNKSKNRLYEYKPIIEYIKSSNNMLYFTTIPMNISKVPVHCSFSLYLSV